MNVYCIHDKQAETYETPFTLPNHAYAIRSFQDAVNKDTPYGKYPTDFELVHLGTYDQETGKFESLELPVVLSQATDYKNEQSQQK